MSRKKKHIKMPSWKPKCLWCNRCFYSCCLSFHWSLGFARFFFLFFSMTSCLLSPLRRLCIGELAWFVCMFVCLLVCRIAKKKEFYEQIFIYLFIHFIWSPLFIHFILIIIIYFSYLLSIFHIYYLFMYLFIYWSFIENPIIFRCFSTMRLSQIWREQPSE